METNKYIYKEKLQSALGEHDYYSLTKLQENGYNIKRLPISIRIMLENCLRNYDGFSVTTEHIETLLNWSPEASEKDIAFKPARVLMQDFTGVPAIVDIASLRAEMARKGKDPNKINPLIPVDLVIDHSVQVDYFGSKYALDRNIKEEYNRNNERYRFLKWGQKAFENFSVVPPGMGICHQVNLEYLSKGVIARDGEAFPDTLVGTDSHTPMVNGIGVVAWGVGGIEAEAAILGQPLYFVTPQVIGLKLTNELPAGTTATDLVLTIAQLLRSYGVVGKFVEVFGPGLKSLSVPDRATIGNMSPEFGCTITYFPIDEKTLEYMEKSNRSQEQINLVETYCKANMLWSTEVGEVEYTDIIELDMSTVEPSVAGPKRPQDKILLSQLKNKFKDLMQDTYSRNYVNIDERVAALVRWGNEGGEQQIRKPHESQRPMEIETAEKDGLKTVWISDGDQKYMISDGTITVAAITSCTNTSNPYVMIGAGLVAKKARELGVTAKPWVKTSLAPGSKVVTDYLEKADLMGDLEAMKFHTVGYGCTSCIGNSGPLPQKISEAIDTYDIVTASVLSGNRNFEARIHPEIKMNFLMSPMLVVAYAIAGRVDIDLTTEPLSYDRNNEPVYLKDIWPSHEEISELMNSVLTAEDFKKNYSEIFDGNEEWQSLEVPTDELYHWEDDSTYVREVPFFKDLSEKAPALSDIESAYPLLVLGHSITTDHISPAGSFNEESAAGKYLISKGVERAAFNSYGSRRGNDEVMTRGTFANVRIRNKIASKEGGYSTHLPTGKEGTVYDVAQKYIAEKQPLIILAGKEYGSGSSRDWAAKGTYLLGVKAVIAESYERIHRSNLVGMGVLPLEYENGESAEKLGLTGKEQFTIRNIAEGLEPMKKLNVEAKDENGKVTQFKVTARLDSPIDVVYYENEGILQYVLRKFINE